ncbi:MAG: serine/threonine-protein kinase [Gemmatimonadales bacterium]
MSADDQAVQGHDLQQELRDALAPELLLLERIGQGGMGDVFLARDPVLKRNVAVKVLARHLGESAEARQRFLREAEAAAAVAHPNVVPIYRIGALPKSKLAYIVMAHVEGHSLRELFPEGSVASESEVRQVMAQVASALSAAHARGVVHRDIKPANVLQDPLGGRWVVVDFGIAALEGPASPAGARLTAEGRPIGTPAYMSPEQAAGDPVGPKSDVYSLGCLAFELLTGRPPFSGPTPVSVVAGHLQKAPPSVGGLRSDLSTELALLVMRCLLKEPDQRPSAAEVARALGAVQRAAVEWPPPGLESLHQNGVKWVRSAGLFAITLLLFVLILGVHPSAARPCCTGTPDRSPGWLILKQLSMLTPIRFDDPDALAIWYFLLDAAFFVLLAGLLPLIWRTAELGRLLVSGRRNGYPFRVLGRVAWDRHRDTGSLINLTGRYALLAPERQRLLLRRRTRAAELQGLAILLLIGGCLLWLAGVLSLGLPADQGLLPLSELLLITGPAAIAFVAFLVLAAIDLGASRRYRPSGGRRAAIRRDVLEGWIRTSGHRVEREAGSRFAIRGAGVIAMLIGMLVVLIAAYGLIAVFGSSARLATGHDAAERWLAERADTASLAGARPLDPETAKVLLARIPIDARLERLAVTGRIDSLSARLLIASVGPAFCLNPREVLFGTDPIREDERTHLATLLGLELSLVPDTTIRGLDAPSFVGLRRRARFCEQRSGTEASILAQPKPTG